MRALVLSGGGLFGAWQAGAWKAIAERFQPDLIVGASIGAVNGYAIASGVSPDGLREMWLNPDLANLSHLHVNLRELVERHRIQTRLAVVITDAWRLKPRIVESPAITWRHLAASCAVPLVMAPVRIDGRVYVDGGLLNPLPVWAAVEVGATEIIALNALPEVPSALLRPFVLGFRFVFGYNPPVPSSVSARALKPGRRLGSLRDAMHWKRDNIDRWLAEGYQDAQAL